MSGKITRWLKFSLSSLLATSPMDLVTILASRNLFLRSISQTQKAFQKAVKHGLPEVTPYSLLQKIDGTEDVSIRLRGEVGLPHSTLVPMLELLRLSGARRVLEIGTQYGNTTWHLAANLPEDGHLWSVDLPQQSDREMSGRETQPDGQVGQFYRGTPEEKQITQVLKNSRELSSEDFPGPFDYIFVDGNHDYEFARGDTVTALKLLDGSGIIVWHDYYTLDPRIGVRQFLHELRRLGNPVWHLSQTTCAAMYVSPQIRRKILDLLTKPQNSV